MKFKQELPIASDSSFINWINFAIRFPFSFVMACFWFFFRAKCFRHT